MPLCCRRAVTPTAPEKGHDRKHPNPENSAPIGPLRPRSDNLLEAISGSPSAWPWTSPRSWLSTATRAWPGAGDLTHWHQTLFAGLYANHRKEITA
jgi:hypothetical protein